MAGNPTACSTACLPWYRGKHWNSELLAICEGNPSLSGGFPSLRASNMDSASMSWRHHGDFTDIQSTYHIDISRRKSLMGAVRLEFLFRQLLITWIRFQKLIGTCPAHIQLRGKCIDPRLLVRGSMDRELCVEHIRLQFTRTKISAYITILDALNERINK